MKKPNRPALFLFAAWMVSPAFADDASRAVTDASKSPATAIDRAPANSVQPPSSAALDNLSAADLALVESVFVGQTVSPESESPLNLQQIAAAKRAGGWDLVFVTLKAGRLTDAQNAGDLVRGARRRGVEKSIKRPARGRITVVTTGSGRRMIFYRKPAGEGTRDSGEQGS